MHQCRSKGDDNMNTPKANSDYYKRDKNALKIYIILNIQDHRCQIQIHNLFKMKWKFQNDTTTFSLMLTKCLYWG